MGNRGKGSPLSRDHARQRLQEEPPVRLGRRRTQRRDRSYGPGWGPDSGGLAADLGRAGKFLTATVGWWLRSGGTAPAVEGRGGGAGTPGPGGAGAGLWGGSGLGQRLRARRRMRCRKAGGRAAVLPSESLRRTPASSDLTPRSTCSGHR